MKSKIDDIEVMATPDANGNTPGKTLGVFASMNGGKKPTVSPVKASNGRDHAA